MPELPTSQTQATETKLSRLRGLKPFRPGPDPRRNLKGRPKTFDHFRELAQAIAQRKGKAQEILERWADSPEPALQRAFVEYAFGKVPDKLETTGLENRTTLVLHFDHERGLTDNERGSRISSEIP